MFRKPTILLAILALALLVTLTTPALASDMTGKIISVNPDNLSFVLRPDSGGNRAVDFLLDEDASIYINNVESTLSDLKAGDHVDIIGRQEGDNWLATIIHCERN